MNGLQCQVPLDPLLPVGLHRGPVREGQFSLDVLDNPEGADVEHGVGVGLVLDPAVQQLVVAALLPDQTLVQTSWVENIPGLQSEVLPGLESLSLFEVFKNGNNLRKSYL